MITQEKMNFIRNAIDFTVAEEGGKYPVISDVIVASGIATRAELDQLEADGHIIAFVVEVPSILMPGQVVKNKAYYTERLVPSYVKA